MKYGFWDVSRDRRKAPITKSDRLLELLALVMGVVLLVLTGVFYVEAPETVPSHFNATGEADGWSGKYIYWVMAVVFLLSMVLCATAAYNRNLVNLPIRLKEPVFYRQIGLIGRMCRIMTLGSRLGTRPHPSPSRMRGTPQVCTCSLVVRPRVTSTTWKPVRPTTGMKKRPATHMTAMLAR